MWNTIKRRKRIAQQEADKLWRENHRKELRKNSKELDKFMIFIAPVILLIILILLIAKTKSVFGIIFFVFICIITVLLTLKFRYPSVFNKLIAFRYRGKQNNTFKETVITAIKYDFPKYDKIIRDERDLENIFETFLKMKFPNSNIKSQYRINDCIFDIVIDNIAIELKIGENSKTLDSLFGQVEWYKDHYKDIILVILDTGAVKGIWEYKKRLESKDVDVIFVKYRFRRQHPEKRYKLVEDN